MGDRVTKKGLFEIWKGKEPPDGKGKKKDKGEQSKGKGRKEDNGASLQGGASSSRQIHDANLEQNNSEASSTRQTDDTDSGPNNLGASSSRQIQDASLEQNDSEASSTRQTDDTSDSGPNSLGASSSRQIHDANLEQNNSEASSTRKTDDTDSGPNNSGASSSRQIQDANLEQNNSGDLSRRQADDADSTINPNRNEEFENIRKLSNIKLDRGDIIQKILAGAKDRELSDEERQTIRETTDQFKDDERRRRIQALRESYPNRTGVFGPLLPPQKFIKDLGYSDLDKLESELSDEDIWKFVAEKIGMTPTSMRLIDKRGGITPAKHVLKEWQYKANSTVGTLYSYLSPDFPVVADTF